jgi:spermidine synthase
VVGLGIGTLAAYGRPGDHFRFYEINPAVIHVASHYFQFLRGSEATVDILTGDGRLGLEREPPQSFDLIILDAFSDDAIPVHLLTHEAFQTYFQRLRSGGMLAVHVTNRYLHLGALVEALAADLHKQVVLVHNSSDPDRHLLMADWAILAEKRETLERLEQPAAPRSTAASRAVRPWTDNYSDLLQILR